jgi:hypothetical protein
LFYSHRALNIVLLQFRILLGVGVVVAHLTLTQVVQVRFLYPLPNINTLCDTTVVSDASREDKKPKHADGFAWRSVFLFGNF